MKISDLKTILEGFKDDDEVAVAIKVNDNKLPVVTNDISYGISEHGELMFEIALYDADFDYGLAI